MLAGLARDGGLYTPDVAPKWTPDAFAAFAGQPYAQVAARVMAPFATPDFDEAALLEMANEAYRSFRHAAKAPLTQLDDNLFVLELFHGPTLAFKDFAMQFLGRAMNRALTLRNAHATILGATSGDTGAAAIEAFGGAERTDVFILFPHGRVSEVQRRQMTTIDRPGVHAIALDGSFDDCQDIVKALFGDLAFRDAGRRRLIRGRAGDRDFGRDDLEFLRQQRADLRRLEIARLAVARWPHAILCGVQRWRGGQCRRRELAVQPE